jgi:mRNA-degrading endonuclease RelE of RelBE toxin-antitoxin system
MRKKKYSSIFKKKIKKLKGQEAKNFLNKRNEILNSKNLDFYKNLKHNLKKFKRIHINDSYVILFFGNNGEVYFVDYEHHNKVYKFDKKTLKRYENLKYE